MNAFMEHHRPSIRFEYSCFDRILLNAVIQPLQRPPVVVGFLNRYRNAPSITRNYFREVSEGYHNWVEGFANRRAIPVVIPPKGVRREEWVEKYFHRLGSSKGIAVILKSRENGRIAVSYPSKNGGNRIDFCQRWVWQYYFYLQDQDFGRMFIRVCSYFPFNTRVYVNGHEWLAERMRREGIRFRQHANAFLTCSDPGRLQQLADTFSGKDIDVCVQYWMGKLVPFFSDFERRNGGCRHQLFVSQVEYCTNLVFERRAALDRMSERLLDLNRTIGRPDRLTTIFGRRITKNYGGHLKTQIADYHLANPVIRSDYKRGSIKQYVRDHLMLRVESTSWRTPDLRVNRGVEHLPQLRQVLNAINDRYLEMQQDILETYVDRGQLQKLSQPTRSAAGRRTPGLRVDDSRVLAVMQALTHFVHQARGDRFRTRDIHTAVAMALRESSDTYSLSQLRYDLGKLRAKNLVHRIEGTHFYRLSRDGFRLCVLYLKLSQRLYAPLTAAIVRPVPHDDRLAHERLSTLDRLYCNVDRSLDKLFEHIGLREAA